MTETMRIVVPREIPQAGVGQVLPGKGSGVRSLLRPLSSCASCDAPAPCPPSSRLPKAQPPSRPSERFFPGRHSSEGTAVVLYTSTYFYLSELFLATNLSPSHPVFFLRVTFLIALSLAEPDLQRPAGSLRMNEWCLEAGAGVRHRSPRGLHLAALPHLTWTARC